MYTLCKNRQNSKKIQSLLKIFCSFITSAWQSEICRIVTYLSVYQNFGAWSDYSVSSKILNSVFIVSIVASVYAVAFVKNSSGIKKKDN